MAMTTKRELHQAIDELSEEEVKKVIQVVEVIQGLSRDRHAVDLMPYSGALELIEDPVAYQQRLRDEWP